MDKKKIEYPKPPKDNTVHNYFGTPIADPYAPLECPSAQLNAWIEAERQLTERYISQIPDRDTTYQQLLELYNFERCSVPLQCSNFLLQLENNGLQNQNILYKIDTRHGTKELLLNPNQLSADGTTSLTTLNPSPNGKWLAYGVSEAGSDWVTIHVLEIESGDILPDCSTFVKFTEPMWSGAGYYYCRYDAPPIGAELSQQNTIQTMYYHSIGEDSRFDKLIFLDTSHPLRYHTPYTDGKNSPLFVFSSEGTSGTEVKMQNPEAKQDFRTLREGFAFDYTPVAFKNKKLYLLTNCGAENGHLIAIDTSKPDYPHDVIIAESSHKLEDVSQCGNFFSAHYLKHATSHIKFYNSDGTLQHTLKLPYIGSTQGFKSPLKATESYYSFESFNCPPTIYKLDLTDFSSSIYHQSQTPFNPADFTVEQQFVEHNNVKVPLFLTYKKGLKIDGNTPTLLYGYGGFNINLTPTYSAANIFMCLNGGIYAVACTRGGGEYGSKWHLDGALENKQNVFDDFIAASEYLITKGYTNSKKLAISGGSNGGLLVAACMSQRPDLFAAVVVRVGVLDMLRYHLFTIGWGWVCEYGSSDKKKDFEYLIKYSPLHNLTSKKQYPPTLITTASVDDRVVPAHSYKFAATLQNLSNQQNPMLLRVEQKAGHGAGKSLSKIIAETADIYSFILYNI